MGDTATITLAPQRTVPHLLARVLAEFETEGIAWCYWKSSRRIANVWANDADCDLLVAKSQQHRAFQLLLSHGFKLFPTVASRAEPAVSSFLGYDTESGRLLHVHLQVRLVLGPALLKNYRLPIEEVVLRRSSLHPQLPIRMLDPVSEALLLIVRSAVELQWTDPVFLRNRRAVLRKFELDRTALAERVGRSELCALAGEVMDAATADMVAAALYAGPLETQRRLHRRIRSSLGPQLAYNGIEGFLRGAVRACAWAAGAVNARYTRWPRPWCRTAPGGGLVVAFLGVDGSGKSTLKRAMQSWLGDEVDVLPVYFGTGDGRPSLLLLPLKLLVPLTMRLFRSKPRGASHGKSSDSPPGFMYSILMTLWATALAVEKRIKLGAAHRGARRGLVVITDRYPQDQLPTYNDGPLLPRLVRIPHILRRFEARAYALARRLPPDLVIKLHVPAEILSAREPGMKLELIARRVEELRRLEFPGTKVADVDAARPLNEVLQVVKAEIWQRL